MDEIALGIGLGIVISLFAAGVSSYQSEQCEQAAKYQAAKPDAQQAIPSGHQGHEGNQQITEHSVHPPYFGCWAIGLPKSLVGFMDSHEGFFVGIFTLILAAFTWMLRQTTVDLADAGDRQMELIEKNEAKQQKNTHILQRAYISVEPDGLHPHAKGGSCTPTIEIVNVGKLPARNVRWTIHSILDFDSRRPQSKLAITWALEGEITLPPGARMKQGALEPRKVAHNTESLRPQFGLYVYVWGVVKYDDGFENEQTTHFCHRYNCVNLRNVTETVRFSYISSAMIAAEFGRYHRYGNNAT